MSSQQSFTNEAILELVRSGKLNAQNKRWVTSRISEQQDHELRMQMLRWLSADPEAKYYFGVAMSLGATALLELLIKLGTIDKTAVGSEEEQESGWKPPSNPLEGMLGMFGFGSSSGGAFLEEHGVAPPFQAALNDIGFGESAGGSGLAGEIGNIFKLTTLGFGGFCMMVLILKAIFSGTDLGELLAGVGEILPL